MSPLSPLFPTFCLASTLREEGLPFRGRIYVDNPLQDPNLDKFQGHVVSEVGGLKGHLKSTEFTEADVWRI